MIEPEDVDETERTAQPLDPPAIPLASQCVPVVQRVAPLLPACVERVRRRPGDGGARQKDARMRHVVAATRRDVDRDVADDPHAAAGSVGSELRPLTVESHLLRDGIAAGVVAQSLIQ